MLADSHRFWAEALCSTEVLQRLPGCGKKPYVKAFGCVAYSHVPKDQRKKLVERLRSIRCERLKSRASMNLSKSFPKLRNREDWRGTTTRWLYSRSHNRNSSACAAGSGNMDSIYSNDVWNLVKLPKDCNSLVFKRKTGADGNIERKSSLSCTRLFIKTWFGLWRKI